MKAILIHIFSLFLLFGNTVWSQPTNNMDFHYKIFHKDSVNSTIFIKMDLNTYLATKVNDSKYVKIGLSAVLTNTKNNTSYKVTREFNLDLSTMKNGIHESSFDVAMEDADYELKLTIEDLNFNKKKEEVRGFSKNKKCNAENFMIFNPDSSIVYFQENPSSESIRVFGTYLNCDTLEVRIYDEIQTIALPPFASKRNYPDFGSYSSKVYQICPNIDFELTKIKNKTLYISTENSKGEDGFLFTRFANHYPKIKTVDLLVEPLRYISSRDEYAVLTDTTVHRRAEFEKFWLDKSRQNKDQARYLIREYYSRVEFANEHFSTYKEGWKTDKGMVLIVFGIPERIENEGGQEERWIYEGKSGRSSMSFSFYREEGNFQENDYALIRNPIFRGQWYDAVDSWRSGVPY
ncbi:MAG: GWxTD domain-containing protein [Crocinitomicaceae bacterium]|nr:GWxTD domain-containing protein [Crocinitomicaceae bacterium]